MSSSSRERVALEESDSGPEEDRARTALATSSRPPKRTSKAAQFKVPGAGQGSQPTGVGLAGAAPLHGGVPSPLHAPPLLGITACSTAVATRDIAMHALMALPQSYQTPFSPFFPSLYGAWAPSFPTGMPHNLAISISQSGNLVSTDMDAGGLVTPATSNAVSSHGATDAGPTLMPIPSSIQGSQPFVTPGITNAAYPPLLHGLTTDRVTSTLHATTCQTTPVPPLHLTMQTPFQAPRMPLRAVQVKPPVTKNVYAFQATLKPRGGT